MESMLSRKPEYFDKAAPMGFKNVVASIPPKLYRQERDWTCSIACLRSVFSKFGEPISENEIIDKYSLVPGPQYSADLIGSGLLDAYVYETTDKEGDTASELNRVYSLLSEGATVMVETCKSFDHWLVMLAYFPNECNYTEDHDILFWDPYYNETLLMRASEFCDEWLSGYWSKNGVVHDFIAIKGVKNT